MFALQPELKVFTGSANRELAERICKYIGVPLGQAIISSFPDGETYVKIEENIRGHDVFIIQPTCPPTNEHLMELLIMVDAARRASADRITAVIPFFGYARQDRDRKSTRLNSSHSQISYAVFCLKKKKIMCRI